MYERALNPVRQAQAGDLEAFDMLVQQHAPELFRLASGIVGVADAQDITQETFHRRVARTPKAA